MVEIYVSTDVESDGPIPGPNSMLNFGSAAYLEDKTLINTYTANLAELEGATPDPKTMCWWAKHPQAWAACRENPRDPAEVMLEYVQWIKKLPGTPIFVAYPAGYDFMFIYWYLIKFVGESPFSYRALDIRSYTMGMLGNDFLRSGKEHLPKNWRDRIPHTHHGLDDAIGQGALFCNLLAAQKNLKQK